MADTKISALTNGGTVQTGDMIPVARGGENRRVAVGSAATQDSSAFATTEQGTKADSALQPAGNLSGLASAATARTNLGLGTAATKAASGAGGTVASVSGAATVGRLARFADTSGTILDGGSDSALSILAAGSTTERTLAVRFKVNVLDFYGSNGSLNHRNAWQAAINYVSGLGGGVVYVPPGTYSGWNVASPLIIPSNITLEGVKAQSIIIPDLSTITLSNIYPLAAGAVMITGNPTDGKRAGITSGQSVTDSTVVENVHIRGLTIDNSAYSGPDLSANQSLNGFSIVFCHNFSVVDCEAYNLPSSGIYCNWGRNGVIQRNIVDHCGHLLGHLGSRNGISSSGWIDGDDASFASQGLLIADNIVTRAFQEGIQNSNWKGTIIRNNVLIGNWEYGVEGESIAPGITSTSLTYGYEVPGDTILEGNYIDCYDVESGVYGTGGIIWSSGNQCKIVIRDNVIRNLDNTAGIASNGMAFTSGSGITVQQTDNGTAVIESNYFENVKPGATGSIVNLSCEHMVVAGNIASNCLATSAFLGVLPSKGFKTLIVERNKIINGPMFRFGYITCSAGSSSTAAANEIIFRDNFVTGLARSFIVLNFPNNATVTRLSVKGNECVNINSNGSGSEGFIRLIGGNASAKTLAVSRFEVERNSVSYAGATAYPIIVDSGSVADNALTSVHVYGNNFGSTNLTNKTAIGTPAICAALYEDDNGFPGRPNGRVVIASGAVTMSNSDTLVEIAKTVPATTSVTLPTKVTPYKQFTVKDGAGNAQTYPITLTGTFDGVVNPTISENYGALTFYYNGTTWRITA
ncbi:right-handed parallel beta-helix repeat-containing protein [Tautonia plasticadhaerens]|uniref:Pectate lyase superfamily protein n=1 Tax=Tautonia plasticadhaerens TaxID=2527974 RepID=A0A518H252_9BACT|nr:right-handed parallel beta-helix repeat-containing protein [Tautonia plasticadhaerens]QDV34904.1 Pectate lyase superfamily protein [Tautonia plasticadhaerens]